MALLHYHKIQQVAYGPDAPQDDNLMFFILVFGRKPEVNQLELECVCVHQDVVSMHVVVTNTMLKRVLDSKD